MKKKKNFGLYGTNKRRQTKRNNRYDKEYEEYIEDYNSFDDGIEDDDEYIVDYQSDMIYSDDLQYSDDDGYVQYDEAEYDVEYTEEGYEYYPADDYAEDTESYYEAGEEYKDSGEYYESEEYSDDNEYYESENSSDDNKYYEAEEYSEDNEYYEAEEYSDDNEYYEADDYSGDYYYEEQYEHENEDEIDISYSVLEDYEDDDDSEVAFGSDIKFGRGSFFEGFIDRIKGWAGNMTAFDAIIASTGVVVVVAALVTFSMFLQEKKINDQIEAIMPIGDELINVGVVGDEGLLAMTGAALSGQFATEMPIEEISTVSVEAESETSKVSVSFVSVEKDLKIRFTDSETGELITGIVFEVVLTNSKGKQLVLTDDDMDGIIYTESVTPGVYDAIVTSTDKYKFPTTPQQVTVKDKVEYVVINVQDEVKKESQINVAAEDTQRKDAAQEEVKLTDTVEWVESTKTLLSGTEGYLIVDKNTIADPSKAAMAGSRMLFDTLNVMLKPTSLSLYVGGSAQLEGSKGENTSSENEKIEYTYEWKSSDNNVVTVDGSGNVNAKAKGTATITYTVTKKTTKTTVEGGGTEEVTERITVERYKELSKEEQEKCTPVYEETDDGSSEDEETEDGSSEGKGKEKKLIGYDYKTTKTKEGETKTNETTETGSATCNVTVSDNGIKAGTLELKKSADSCAVGAALTVSPSKLVYTKDDNSTQTITEGFPTVTWSSADTTVATVNSEGVVTGVKAGSTTIKGVITVKNSAGNNINIEASTTVTITAAAALALTLDRTEDVKLAVGATTTLVATVTNYKSDAGVTWTTSDKKIATVDENGKVTAVAIGSATIIATTKEKNSDGKQLTATCKVIVSSDAMNDTTTKLKDKNGNQIYLKNEDGSYKEAVYADYFKAEEFYIKTEGKYAYTGWQTINGRTYYFDKNGNAVTGTQIIQGVTYNFDSDGAIATAVNGSIFGIDISRHNGNIDWNAVKASGVDYVIIRCGYRGSATGVLIEDENFKKNIQGATAAGLKVGVYVFSQAVDEVEAVKEASLAVGLVKGYKLTYPIFIDTESSGGRADKIDKATRTAVVNAFCQTVASAGYQPGIYASKTWFEDKLNMGAIGNYRIWLAQYAAAPTYKSKYDMWQYSSKGTISGITGDVDLNLSYLGY